MPMELCAPIVTAVEASKRATSCNVREYAALPNAPVSLNSWLFDASIFEACERVPKSARGEYELPEAVGLALREGVVVRAERVALPVLDLSQRADIPAVAARLGTADPRP